MIITADYEFDVPVRVDTDQMTVTIKTYAPNTWAQVPVVEIRI